MIDTQYYGDVSSSQAWQTYKGKKGTWAIMVKVANRSGNLEPSTLSSVYQNQETATAGA